MSDHMFFRWDGRKWVLRAPLPKERQPGQTRRQAAKNVLMPVVKMRLIEAAQETCAYCGHRGTADLGPDGVRWHIDHRTPLSRGGSIELDNCAVSCATCNQAKGRLTAEEFLALCTTAENCAHKPRCFARRPDLRRLDAV